MDAVLGRLAAILGRRLPALHAHLAAAGCLEPGTQLIFCYPWVKMLL